MKKHNDMKNRYFFPFLVILLLVSALLMGKRNEIFGEKSLPSAADRVIAVSRLYQTAREYYCYFSEDGISWDAAYEVAIESVLSAKTYREYLRALEEFRANLADCHGDGLIYATGVKRLKDFGMLPFFCTWASGEYVVLQSACDEISVGDTLVQINGEGAITWLEKNLGPIVGTRTPGTRESLLAKRLLTYFPKGTKVACIFQNKNGGLYEATVKVGTYRKLESVSVIPNVNSGMEEEILLENEAFCVKKLPNNILWICNYSLADVAYWDLFCEQIMPLVGESRGVILDFRYHNGGNSLIGVRMLQAISGQEALSEGMCTEYPLITGPAPVYAAQVEGKYGEQYESGLKAIYGEEAFAVLEERGNKMRNRAFRVTEEQYTALMDLLGEASCEPSADTLPPVELGADRPLGVLIGINSGSAIDTIAQTAKDMHIVTIGTRTAGATGEFFSVELGDGLETGFSSFYIKNTESGLPVHNHGVEADIQVDFTAEDIRDGLDRQVIEAWNHLDTALYTGGR